MSGTIDFDHTYLTNNPSDWLCALGDLANKDELGFDTETSNWTMAYQYHKTRTIQLAYQLQYSGKYRCYVFDMASNIDEAIKQKVLAILANPDVLKVGQNTRYDIRLIDHTYKTKVVNVWDTEQAHKIGNEHGGNKGRHSLAKLADIYLGLKLDKGEQKSDWGSRRLTASQVLYAAQDAVHVHMIYCLQRQKGYHGGFIGKESIVQVEAKNKEVYKAQLPGFEDFTVLADLIERLEAFIASGKAANYNWRYYTPNGNQVSDVSYYAKALLQRAQVALGKSVGAKKLELGYQHELSLSCCAPVPDWRPTIADCTHEINSLRQFVRLGVLPNEKAEAERARVLALKAKDDFRWLLIEHEGKHEKIAASLLAEEKAEASKQSKKARRDDNYDYHTEALLLE